MTGDAYFDTMDDETVNSLMEGFQVIDFDWKYIYLNDAVLKQSKYPSKHDLLGFTMMEKYSGIETTALFKKLRLCMIERVPQTFENEFIFPDASRGWFELRIEPVPKGIVILSVDITARKAAEEARVVQIRSLEEMIFMCSHKVRQPVAHILAVSELLGMKNSTPDEVHKIAGFMKESAISLDKFTRELTAYIHEIKGKVSGG